MNLPNCWLPPLIEYNTSKPWIEYELLLYSIFKDDFINSQVFYQGKIVKVRFQPIISGYEEAFIHFTCSHYDNDETRVPDLRRCERIKWIRSFIENHKCKEYCPNECDGIKIWDVPHKTYLRTHFLLEEEKFLVVIEKRETYNLLITGYYLDYSHSLEKKLRQYYQYKAKGASL